MGEYRVGGNEYLIARGGMPWLVQRVERRAYAAPGATGVDTAFGFDYMGSSEFEWGALPAALREMRRHHLVIRAVRAASAMYFVGREDLFARAHAFVDDQLGRKDLRLKEMTRLGESMADPESRIIGWWALDQECPWLVFKNKKDAALWLKLMGNKEA